MRTPLIAGNWKMHKTNQEAVSLVGELSEKLGGIEGREVAVCPPYTALAEAAGVLREAGSGIKLGAQNVYPEEEGAFTGEISPSMLEAIGLDYVIVGHSERREVMGEDDGFIARKMRAVLDTGMNPILCVGETLEERDAGNAKGKVEGQIEKDLSPLRDGEIKRVVIAYEPIWAIGTGKTATPQDAQEMNGFIRKKLSELYGEEEAQEVRILYGGSVKPGNIGELMSMQDVDGALVGGASLEAESFSAIASF